MTSKGFLKSLRCTAITVIKRVARQCTSLLRFSHTKKKQKNCRQARANSKTKQTVGITELWLNCCMPTYIWFVFQKHKLGVGCRMTSGQRLKMLLVLMINLFAEYFGLFVEAPFAHYICRVHNSHMIFPFKSAAWYTCMLCVSAMCGRNDV